MADLFAECAVAHPDRVALTIVDGSAAAAHSSLSYGELDRRARARAARLGARFGAGERVLVVLPTCAEFAELLLACLYSGLVAVPVPEPTGSTAVERVASIVADSAPRLAITTAGGRDDLQEQLHSHGLGQLPVEAIGAPGPDAPSSPGPRPDRDSLAVLQYSSGSTGEPKGVVITHGAILAHTEAMHSHGELGPDDAFGSWLPLHHDMGLFVMFLGGMLLGSHVVLMSPVGFSRRPAEWFRMLDRYGCSVTAGPNFAFELCLRAVPDAKLTGLDLSRLRRLFNGSEPIHPESAMAFTRRFAEYGLRPETVSPCYGLAEATAYVSVTPRHEPPVIRTVDPARLAAAKEAVLVPALGGRDIIGVGTLGDIEARIVDPASGRRLPDGAVGEIWLHGRSVGNGYWDKPDLTERIFRARFADDHRNWLRTGDLGAFLDGELFITGRIKEMLVIAGRNIFPQDVEHEARAAHEALAGFAGAVFGVPAPDERMVLVHEVSPAVPHTELPEVATAVARRLATSLGIPVRNMMLVRRGTVRRTTSGKIRRAAMRERFLAGDIRAILTRLEPAVQRMTADSPR
ncbi:fatty acyl-AMP ligase [Streptomyces sp. NPDC088350]|uniref:fatty acyl-AMP ligase n=1 Tax=Streptomyces sp. NPDC088350 TaxID=3365854 RepID=UPI0038179AC9